MIERDYYTLSQAAYTLTSALKANHIENDLLHLGATGRLILSINLEYAGKIALEDRLSELDEELEGQILEDYEKGLPAYRDKVSAYLEIERLRSDLVDCLPHETGKYFAMCAEYFRVHGPFSALPAEEIRRLEFDRHFLGGVFEVEIDKIVDRFDFKVDDDGNEYYGADFLPMKVAVRMDEMLVMRDDLQSYIDSRLSEAQAEEKALAEISQAKAKRISDKNLKEALGAVCLYVSKKEAKYRTGDKPNFKAISELLTDTLAMDDRESSEGLSNLERGLREAFAEMDNNRPKKPKE